MADFDHPPPQPTAHATSFDIMDWSSAKMRLRYYVPILRWLPRYNYQKDLIHDALAGFTVAFLLIPQSLSYASSLANLEPVYGLYTSFFPIIVYGILGTSRQLSVGPEALVSLLVGSTIKQTAGADSSMQEHISIAIALTLLVGLITFGMGLTRMGFFDSVLSRALLRGFITAVACVIVIEQLPGLLGISSSNLPPGVSLLASVSPLPPPSHEDDEPFESPFLKLVDVLEHLGDTNWVTALISFFSIVFLLGFKRMKVFLARRLTAAYGPSIIDGGHQPLVSRSNSPIHETYESFQNDHDLPLSDTSQDNADNQYSQLPMHVRSVFYIPEIFIVVLVAMLLTYSLKLNETHSVAILGEAALQGGFRRPTAAVLNHSRFKKLIPSAIIISVLGFVESIVASKHYASKYHYPVSANRELVAYGTINLVGSLFNCFPCFASIARSQVHDSAGARTQLSGIITGMLILLTILFFLPIFFYLPKAVMASVVFVAATGLLEFEDVLFMWKIRAWQDILLMALTFLITIFWSVESGTLISIGLSLILVVRHTTSPKISILGKVTEDAGNDLQQSIIDEDTPRHNATSSAMPVPKVKYRPLEEIFQRASHNQQQLSNEDLEILIVKIDEGLFFANTGQLKDRLHRAEVYGGFLHVHPGEEERRPVVANDRPRPTPTPRRLFTQTPTGESNALRTPLHSPTSTAGLPSISGVGSESGGTNEVLSSIHTDPPILRAVVFDIENMPYIDASALQVLIEITEVYHKRGVEVCFVKLRETCKEIFLKSGLLGEVVGSDHFFRKISDAMRFLREKWSNPDGQASSYSAYRDLL